jgi:DNA mismatch repair protein MutL
VERPSTVVKELVENALDAGATAITAEIKEGGLSLIRITDNGGGIARDDIPLAFMRHATSKIKTSEDLFHVTSLGFRGEALSSIAAVSQVELITKEPSSLNGYRYIIEGGEEKSIEEIGCPSGTTIIVRNLFYNTPARRKFLKSATTEAGYVNDLMERLMVSHPEVSFRFIVNNQIKHQSSGNNNIKDILYSIYGRDITKEILPVEYASENVNISGYIGKPTVSRGNRNFENYFINGRYIKNSIITKAIEDAYKPFMMQHKYPFTSLYYEITPSLLDVNVHPQKSELKLTNGDDVYEITYNLIRSILSKKELIPKVTFSDKTEKEANKPEYIKKLPEPFENNRMNQLKALETMAQVLSEDNQQSEHSSSVVEDDIIKETQSYESQPVMEQIDLFSPFISEQAISRHRIIGQVFSTYWLVEYEKELYIIDQHAAHEKVLYERIMTAARENKHSSQMLMPPIVLTLSLREQVALKRHNDTLQKLGYEIEHFGGNEFSIRAVPSDLYNLSDKDLFLEFIDEMTQDVTSRQANPESIMEKIASMACKAAVKANHVFSLEEATSLIKELLSLENPYHCPHGRPVIISMSRYELEKKFKRVL